MSAPRRSTSRTRVRGIYAFAKPPALQGAFFVYNQGIHAILTDGGHIVFIDKVRIHVKGGDGGAGCMSFRREAHVPRAVPMAATAASKAISRRTKRSRCRVSGRLGRCRS